MKQLSYSQQLAARIISRLEKVDPDLARMVADKFRARSQMAGWVDDLTGAFTGAVSSYTEIALDKERAKINASAAKDIAKQEAEILDRQIQLEVINAQTEAKRNELMAQQFEIQRFMKELELEKWQKGGLIVAGLLTLGLIFNRIA